MNNSVTSKEAKDFKYDSPKSLADSLFEKANQIRKIDSSYRVDLTSIIEFICWINEQSYLTNEYTARNGYVYSFSEVKILDVFKPLVAPRSVTVGGVPQTQVDLKSSEWFIRPMNQELATPDEMLSVQTALCAALRVNIDPAAYVSIADVRIDKAIGAGERYAYGLMWYCPDGQFAVIPTKLDVILYQDRVMNDSVEVAFDEYVNYFYTSIRKSQIVRA